MALSKSNRIKPENLVGRQVYFKCPKKVWDAESTRNYLTPGKLYTLIEDICLSNDLYVFLDDKGSPTYCYAPNCPHLGYTAAAHGAHWILKRRAK